jgi:hypothetical protein
MMKWKKRSRRWGHWSKKVRGGHGRALEGVRALFSCESEFAKCELEGFFDRFSVFRGLD